MAKASPQSWRTTTVPTAEILLDLENPRVEIPPRASQATIRRLLVATEEVIELARDIVETGGLLPGDRIIVVKEGETFIVLEGNRRVCACQILTNIALAPPNTRKGFPEVTPALAARLKSMQAEIAPSREAAEVIITRRHTSFGIKQWSPIAKQRRIMKRVEQGESLADIATAFTMKRTDVFKTLQSAHLLKYIRDLKRWSEAESAQLDDPKLKPTTFTRLFTTGGVRDDLEISFDAETGAISSGFKHFADAMELLARETLLIPLGKKVTNSTTRTPTPEIYRKAFAKHPALNRRFNEGNGRDREDPTSNNPEAETPSEPEVTSGANGNGPPEDTETPSEPEGASNAHENVPREGESQNSGAQSGASDGTTTRAGDPGPESPESEGDSPAQAQSSEERPHENPAASDPPSSEGSSTTAVTAGAPPTKGTKLVGAKPDTFFQSLVCPATLRDQRLITLSREISKLDHTKFPAAATFLLRALLESTLQYIVDTKGLRSPLMQEYLAENPAGKPEPGLKFVINFVMNPRRRLFTGNVVNVLKKWQDHTKAYCDIVIHGRWIEPSAHELEEVAKTTRLFITKVFDGTALLP